MFLSVELLSVLKKLESTGFDWKSLERNSALLWAVVVVLFQQWAPKLCQFLPGSASILSTPFTILTQQAALS